MKVIIAKSAGFCSGVKRAIGIAFSSATKGKPVEMLGDIVHNEEAVSAINDAGIIKVNRLSSGRGKVLLIRAHGAPTATYEKAKSLGYEVVDATCPMVKEIHRVATKHEDAGYSIVIIGDKQHDEVLGILGQLKYKALILDCEGELPIKVLRKMDRVAIVVQSTQNVDKVLPLVEKIKEYARDVKFCNTICMPTKIKQREIRSLPNVCDVVLVIGSRHSANTKRLFEISSSINKKTFWVDNFTQLKAKWFDDTKCVGITAGASTPREAIAAVADYVKINF
jgi:4-hydroxy-3-methylbut-2-enyl diphosphate reductase